MTQPPTSREDRLRLENQGLRALVTHLERQAGNLTGLYVAARSLLHATDRAAMLEVVADVIVNLIGSERFAVFELEPDASALSLVTAHGVDRDRYGQVALGLGRIGAAAVTNQRYVADVRDANEPVVVVPVGIPDRVMGVIAIFELLPQKPALQECDHHLLDLLAAATRRAIAWGPHFVAGARDA